MARCQGRGAGSLPRGEREREGGESKTRLSKKRKETERVEGDSGREAGQRDRTRRRKK